MSDRAGRLALPRYRGDIDGLRALAVLAVVGFHAFPDALPGGFVGVDVFFVISGFLITTIIVENLEREQLSFAEFYARRIRRLFPSLAVVLIASLAWGWFLLPTDEYKQLGKHVAAGAGFVSNLVLWQESSGYFEEAATLKPLLHLWSLGIEEQFYLAWPAFIAAAWLRKWRITVAIGAVIAVSFALSLAGIEFDPRTAFYSPMTRFWELAVGAWLACTPLLRGRAPDAPPRPALSWIGVALIAAGFAFAEERDFPGAWALLPTIGTALVVFAGAGSWINRQVLSSRVLVGLGLISYPLYLWHWPLLTFARLLEHQVPVLEARLAVIASAVALAWITYRFVEKPLRFGGHARWKTAVLVVVMAAVGLAGLDCYRRDGWSFRFPPEMRMLTSHIDFQWMKFVRGDECYLRDTDVTVHPPQCRESRRPLVVLWGDSHAASLYPALHELQAQRGFGLSQFTQAVCAPMFDLDLPLRRRYCNDINRNVMDVVAKDRPDVLVVHAAWVHDQYPLTNEELEERALSTLETMRRKLPKTDIVVIGPVPRWVGSPQATVTALWLRTRDQSASLPVMQKAIVFEDADRILQKVSAEAGVRYISATKAMCNADGCVSRAGGEPTDFVAIDDGHMSRAGAVLLMGWIGPEVLARIPAAPP